MNREGIRSAIISAWHRVSRPVAADTGLAYEAPEVESAIRDLDYLEISGELRRFDKYYLFCYLTKDYACYFSASYMLFGLSNWHEQPNDDLCLSDPLAENLFYFLTGQRWPIEELRNGLSHEQIHAIYEFLSFFSQLVLESSLLQATKQLFPEALEAWKGVRPYN